MSERQTGVRDPTSVPFSSQGPFLRQSLKAITANKEIDSVNELKEANKIRGLLDP